VGKFDLETDAALVQLNFEEIAKTPGGEFAEIIGDLLALIGTRGPWAVAGGASNLLLKIRNLAGASYTSNLLYVITAVRNDLSDLYAKHAESRECIKSLRNDPAFSEAIAAIALRAMHTSVKGRLKRLARVVVNGVKEGDLEAEGLDDMLRAATELDERVILLLKELCELPAGRPMNMTEADKGRTDSEERMGSVAKLQTVAFVQLRTAGLDLGASVVVLLPKGRRFYDRLQEIGTAK
jgi:hypothetical protein